MSRPRWSEPSQCAALGWASVWAASVAMGSCVWSWSANSAVTAMTSMRTPPAAPSGFLRQNRRSTVTRPGRLGRRAGTAAMVGRGAVMGPVLAIAHTRIEEAVEHVHEQVRQDDDHRDEHHEVLHDGIVPPEDGVDEE